MGESDSSARHEFLKPSESSNHSKKSAIGPLIQQNLESLEEFEVRWVTYLLKYFAELFINFDWFNNYFAFEENFVQQKFPFVLLLIS